MAAKKKTEAPAKASFQKPTERDFAVIIKPVITEKSMAEMQNSNKVTMKVAADTNKTEVKLAFERIFQVKVVDVRILNVKAKQQPEEPVITDTSKVIRKRLSLSQVVKQSTYSENSSSNSQIIGGKSNVN